jgi:predicted DNA binding CopG/RHH family protein
LVLRAEGKKSESLPLDQHREKKEDYMSKKTKNTKEIKDYDKADTSAMIDKRRKLRFDDIGLELPPVAPTQVVSIRLPTELLNELKALSSIDDVPYQATIKLLLAEGIRQKKNKIKKSA